jgi:dipeptidyl aminopeptidase/acylaminoacyl peptidase
LIWNVQTGERTDLELAELEGELLPVEWSADGTEILLWHLHGAVEQLYRYDLRRARPTRLDHPSGSFGDFKATAFFSPNDEIWVSLEDAAHPPRLLALDRSTGGVKRTVLAVGSLPPGRPLRSVTFVSSDGQPVQGWLGLPDREGPFPTILEMHGGPHMMRPNRFDPAVQAWLERGFAFLSINFRGSTSFGRAFQEKIWGNIGHWELEDMVAARDWLVGQGIARPDAILLHGASYGGYLTLWGLGKRPDLWAGGLAVVPGTDWLVAYDDASEALKGAFRAWFGGTPDEKRAQYIASSPVTYVENVRSPVLIIQGRHDTRVPPREVEVYEARMRALGKLIEVIWYDGGHGTTSTEQAIEFTDEMLKFATRILPKPTP